MRSYRPWGFFESLSTGARFQVKLLTSSRAASSRCKCTTIGRSTGGGARDRQGYGRRHRELVQENESVYITATQWHRLENPGKVPLELIEAQTGSHLGEDDIIRTDDVYHRAPDETRQPGILRPGRRSPR